MQHNRVDSADSVFHSMVTTDFHEMYHHSVQSIEMYRHSVQ